ncbi:hypothetical protein GCM10010123_35860 [Pilimelia anulata]|uniref:Uncharacterized protein n=1 Tax=Pilimelia anulata TaxID=53371 RepID=A0A8J3FBQ8_9ACTN|nr:hypothetical protein GCM10010123_35860 [Pilimelia anulata]
MEAGSGDRPPPPRQRTLTYPPRFVDFAHGVRALSGLLLVLKPGCIGGRTHDLAVLCALIRLPGYGTMATEQIGAKLTTGGDDVRVEFLGKDPGSNPGDCPSLYRTDRNTYVVQGWVVTDPEELAAMDVPEGESVVEIPASDDAALRPRGIACERSAPPR